MTKKTGTALVSVEELEKQLAPIMKTSAAAVIAAEPVFSAAQIVRTKNKTFALGDQKLAAPLRIVILGWSYFQAFYEDEYDPDTRTPPVCFAVSPTEGDLAPHETAPKKQHAGPCATCPQNKPGTGAKGGWTRACSGRRRVAFLFADDKSEDPQAGSIEISPGGLKPFSLYVKSLAGIHSAPPYLAVTELNFVDTKKDTWYVGAQFGGMLTRARADWLSPAKGVRVGQEGWLDTTMVGRKLRELQESKTLLAPPSLAGPAAEPKGKRPVTGAKRVSVKDARALRKTGKKAKAA